MGAIGHDGLAIPGKVDLAHEPPFAIGKIAVDPALRQVVNREVIQTLEPRVMQVLVALARGKGAIVTRDELSAWCWDGRIVGEDALNRTLSRVRHVAAGIGQGSFHVETITKVGYRLLVDAGENETTPITVTKTPRSDAGDGDVDRRRWIAGAMLAGIASVAGAAWWKVGAAYRPNAEARAYYRKGVEARSLGLVESGDQATSYFSQAVRADPDYADAWGALARQKTNGLYAETQKELDLTSADVRSAANRALALDPDQAEAQSALALIQPYFRRWHSYEAGLARVTKAHPEQYLAIMGLGNLYSNVARWEDSIAKYREVRATEPMRPGPTGALALAYWAAGRIEEAEAESVRALEQWPRFHGMWFTRMILLTYSGKPEQAVAFGQNSEFHPSGTGAEKVIETRLAMARALVSGSVIDLETVRTEVLKMVDEHVMSVPAAARFLCASGDSNTLFGLLDAYFYRRGRFARNAAKAIHSLTRLQTDFLFYPISRILWDDPRFAALTRDIGLDDYWRSVRFLPAHRRR